VIIYFGKFFYGPADRNQPSAIEFVEKLKGYSLEIVANYYEESLRNFYYENSVRELLFFHFTQSENAVPAELENKDITKIYELMKLSLPT